ncbi:MAG: histidine kinase [Bacteroidales bacterium]|nr:histidine kinase [Bacteroidales bacterium]
MKTSFRYILEIQLFLLLILLQIITKYKLLPSISINFILFVSSFVFVTHIFSQELDNVTFNRITTENVKIEKGLSQNSVFCILQDKLGYIWFGTWDGLNKYDGYKFYVYNKTNGLSGQTINALYEDKKGIIWIGTDKGLNKFNRKKQKFTHYLHNEENPQSIVDDNITTIAEDNDENLWIGTSHGLSKFDKKTEGFQNYLNYPGDNRGIRSNVINKMCFDENDFLWIATNYGLIKFDKNNNRPTRFYHTSNDTGSLNSNTILFVYNDNSNNLYVGTDNGLNRFNASQKTFSKVHYCCEDSIKSNRITSVFEDNSGNLWVGTGENGIFVREKNTNWFSHHINKNSDQKSLSNNMISCIYEDRTSTIWIGTLNGVNKIDEDKGEFRIYRQLLPNGDNQSVNYIRSIIEDEAEVYWLATLAGINIVNLKTGENVIIQNDPYNNNSLSENNIRSIIKDRNHNYWIATDHSGLDKFDRTNNEFTHYTHGVLDTNCICDNKTSCLIEDYLGNIWVGTNDGLSRIDPETEEITNYFNDPKDNESLSHNFIRCFFEDSDSNLWIGTDDGLNKFARKDNKFITYKNDSLNPTSISDNRIFSIYEDKFGVLWIATVYGGLNKMDRETDEFKSYSKDKGLPHNLIYDILEDENNNLWISSNWGLSKFNTFYEKFINYDATDGLQGNEFNLGASLKSSNGIFLFGGTNGLTYFIPEKIKTNLNKPPLVLTNFKIFNEEQGREIFNYDTIRLNYDDNFFSFEFSALDFSSPLKNSYKYKLENYDKNWVIRDANTRFAEYTKVSPGTYYFKVKGSNNDGIWNESELIITVIIKPPWWTTWFFRISFGVLMIVLIWFLINRRFKHVKSSHEVEKKVLLFEKQLFDLEQKALRLQMNPHFIFNSLNSIQSFVIANDTKKAIFYLAKFSQLMRSILTNSSESVIPLKEEIKALKYYLDIEKLRFDDMFDYEIKIAKGIDDEFFEIPPMIVQPYVENAIIHGLLHSKKEGFINIDFNLYDNNSILCTIKDNGIGREKSQEINEESGLKRKSRGMMITKQRLEIMNKGNDEKYSVKITDLKDSAGKALGTKIELIINYKSY